MKIIMPQETLIKAIRSVMPAVSTKLLIPVLGGIHVQADMSGTVQFTATDMSVSLSKTTTGFVADEGSMVIEAKRLQSLVDKIPGGEVAIESAPNSQAIVRWGKAKAALATHTSDQFPTLPVPGDPLLTVSSPRLALALKQTLFAAGTDGSKPWLNGVNVSIRNGTASVCGTDSVRIAFWKGDLGIKDDIGFEQVIPKQVGLLLQHLMPAEDDAVVQVGISQNSWVFQLPSMLMTSRTVEGQYPNLERLLHADYPVTVRVNREELIGALQRALNFGTNSEVRWDIRPGELLVRAKEPEGEIEDPLPCELLSGDSAAIGFNAKIVLAGLKAFSGTEVEIDIISPKQPARFRSSGDPELRYVVMPLIRF